MSKQPTMEQWKALYEVASVIKIIKPWESLWDMDLITIQPRNINEPVFVSAMGRIGECFGIGVYPGYDSINSLFDLADANMEEMVANPMYYQNCLMCYYGSRDELSPKEREIIKSLGLKFRGENNWIYFRKMREGFYPWFLDAEDVVFMTEVLQNAAMVYKYILSGEVKVDFNNDETLLRTFSEERNEWINYAAPLPDIPVMTFEFTNQDTLDQIQSLKKTAAVIELDQAYLPIPVQDKKDDTPFFPQFIAVVDHKSGKCLLHNSNEQSNDVQDEIFDVLLDYIIRNGRPATIYVRNSRVENIVKDFCEKVGIRLVVGKKMTHFDEIFEGLLGSFEQ